MKSSELALTPAGLPYHTHLGPDHLADDVVLVGDPGRVALFRRMFSEVEYESSNREMHALTGRYNRHRFTVLSTGMGCDNIDIVMTELDEAANMNLATGDPLPVRRTLNIVRLGTCGSLQGELDAGSLVASAYAIGLDGLLNYYTYDPSLMAEELQSRFLEQIRLDARMATPYAVAASGDLLERLAPDMARGITVTAPGFYAPQGRHIRIAPTLPDLNENLSAFSWNGIKINNLEMETSGIYGLSRIMSHKALTICLVIANRVSGKFLNSYEDDMERLIGTTLDRMSR